MAALKTLRTSYPLWGQDKLRYADLDRQGHVNNAVFATFLETGRVTYILDLLDPGETYLLARIEIDFLGEVHYPGTVDIGTRVLSIGRTSYRLGGAVFAGERCVATAESVLVLADEATRQPKPLSPRLMAWLERYLDRSSGG